MFRPQQCQHSAPRGVKVAYLEGVEGLQLAHKRRNLGERRGCEPPLSQKGDAAVASTPTGRAVGENGAINLVNGRHAS